MNSGQRFRARLVGLCVGVLAALLIWPATRRLVRSQIALVLPMEQTRAAWSQDLTGGGAPSLDYAMRRYRETATRDADDFQIQLAYAIQNPTGAGVESGDRLQRLRQLAERFPDRPAAYAALLRFSTLRQVRVLRPELYAVVSNTAPAEQPSGPQVNTPEELAAFDRFGSEGERLDPDNAYFPMMRAVGLFAGHRDAEALEALRRAAAEHNWNDYTTDEIEAEWKMCREAFGAVGTLPRMARAGAVLLPHLSELRVAGIVAVARAVEAEQAGRLEEGLAIGDSVMRCGALLRARSPMVIGSLIGREMFLSALSRPGGAALPVRSIAPAERAQTFDAYLRRIGFPEQTSFVDEELAAGNRARAIVVSAVRSGAANTPVRLALWWMAAVLLLSSAFWVLALGAAAALVGRSREIRAGHGLARSSRLTAVIAILAAAPLVGWAFVRETGGALGPLTQIVAASMGEGRMAAVAKLTAMSLWTASAVLPCALLLAVGILSLVWRVPLSVGLTRGLRGLAVPTVCVLLLAYCALVPVTLRQETILDEALKQTVERGGRYLAQTVGEQWPGLAR